MGMCEIHDELLAKSDEENQFVATGKGKGEEIGCRSRQEEPWRTVTRWLLFR
jgi:hypothetical protein